jgi:predicted metal-dependent hydrolase
LGEPHTLIFSGGQNLKPTIYVKDQQIFTPFVNKPQIDPCVEPLLKQWYRQRAQQLLVAKTALWSIQIAVEPQRITIKEQKTRWGSCSSKSNINYNWRIVMAPPEVIDYLVIHELCHLRVPNHSPLFWQEVARFSPHFKQHRTWLKDNGPTIMNILTT